METTEPVQNPYASPATPGEARPPEWYLLSACRYYKVMGWMVIVYFACVVPATLVQAVMNAPLPVGEVVGMPIMATAFSLFFGWMIRTASQLPTDFKRLYKRARWQGILTGAIACPILTIPAFIAVSRLAKYRAMLAEIGKETVC